MLEIGVLVGCSLVLLYIWLTWNYNHWKKMGVPYEKPNLIFGNVKDFVLMRKCKGIVYHELYSKSDAPALGIFKMRKPQLLVRDPNLIKILTVNEFANFKENDVYTEPNDFILSTNIFFFAGDKWKRNRSKITPALTMSKLKLFVPHMVEIGQDMIKYLDDNQEQELEARGFTRLFTMETAMSYVYGVRCETFKNPNSVYSKLFDELFDPSWWMAFKFLIAHSFPSIGHFFKLGRFSSKAFVKFYTGIVGDTIQYRKKNNVSRKDFLQYIMESEGKDGAPELSVLDITGLTMNITTDATETSSAALSQVIDALIRYPKHQEKLVNEIDQVIHNIEDITYENIKSIAYLNAFILEALRILPPAGHLEKRCTNDCEINYNGKTYVFKRGDTFAISVYSTQTDPSYFPDPDIFDPLRFMDGDDPNGFAPFGFGPRACLGRPLALLQVKVFLCLLLKYYRVLGKPAKKEFDPYSSFFLILKDGIKFKVRRR